MLDPDTYLGKIDHQVSERNHISGAVVENKHSPGFLWWAASLAADGEFLSATCDKLDVPRQRRLHAQSLYVEYVRRWIQSVQYPPGSTDGPATLVIYPGHTRHRDLGIPNITFGNGYQAIGSTNFFNYVNETELVKDGISWEHGTHSFKFGGEWRLNEHNSIVNGNSMGVFSFTSAYTANPSALSTTGDSFASFLLGGYNTVSSSGPLVYNVRWSYGGIYAQDQWRIMPRLTLTYGLRWEWQTPPWETHNKSGEVSLTTPNPGAGNLPGAVVFAGGANGSTFGSTDLSSIGPRVGFAWNALERTVFRGGYGIYYDKWTSGSNVFGIDSPGFQASYSNASQNSGLTPAGSLSAGLPTLSTNPNLSSTVLNGQSATWVDPSSWKMPRVQNWSAGIQQQFTSNMIFELSYVGIHGTRQNAYLMSNVNQVNPKYLSLGPLLTQSISSPGAVAAGIPAPYAGFKGTVAQALRPYPQYQTLTSYLAKPGKSTYNALEARIRQRFNNGMSFDISYTWSKNLGYPDTVNIAVGGVNNLLENAYNPKAGRSLFPNDVPHAFVAAWVYDLPLGAGRRFGGGNLLARELLGGWTVSAIQRYQSGTPLQIYEDNNLPLFNYVQRPNVVSGLSRQSSIVNPNTDRRINLQAFSAALPYTFGTSPPTLCDLRQFAVLQEDVALKKQISLGESWKFELSGQSFNVANRHRFTSIVTDYSSSSFGKAGGSSIGRYVQLGAKLRF